MSDRGDSSGLKLDQMRKLDQLFRVIDALLVRTKKYG